MYIVHCINNRYRCRGSTMNSRQSGSWPTSSTTWYWCSSNQPPTACIQIRGLFIETRSYICLITLWPLWRTFTCWRGNMQRAQLSRCSRMMVLSLRYLRQRPPIQLCWLCPSTINWFRLLWLCRRILSSCTCWILLSLCFIFNMLAHKLSCTYHILRRQLQACQHVLVPSSAHCKRCTQLKLLQ